MRKGRGSSPLLRRIHETEKQITILLEMANSNQYNLDRKVFMSKLGKNEKAPDFKLQDQDGKFLSLSDLKGEKVFLYFYPRANTPGCTTQSCNVQEALPDFSGLKVRVLGISPDTPEKQKKFAEKYNLQFPLLCDVEKKTAEAYGVWGEKKLYGKISFGIVRSSFLIDEEGKIEEAWYKVSPKDTVPKVMELLK